MATPEIDDRTLEQMGAVAAYCRAAETLQRAEFRCVELGLYPRNLALHERAQFFALMEKMEGPPVEHDGA